jgi:hypothetical protein
MVGAEGVHLIPGHPAQGVELREARGENGALRGHHQVAQVEVLVCGLAAARRDVVHVHIERAWCGRVEREPGDPGLLESLAQGHLLAGRLAVVGVAPRLEPAVELAVVQQQDARAVGRDGDRASRQVALEDAAVEGPLVANDEGEDPLAVPRFLVVDGHMATERLDERLA